jgi:hypothetical protein
MYSAPEGIFLTQVRDVFIRGVNSLQFKSSKPVGDMQQQRAGEGTLGRLEMFSRSSLAIFLLSKSVLELVSWRRSTGGLVIFSAPNSRMKLESPEIRHRNLTQRREAAKKWRKVESNCLYALYYLHLLGEFLFGKFPRQTWRHCGFA